jgi:hypothetical protein
MAGWATKLLANEAIQPIAGLAKSMFGWGRLRGAARGIGRGAGEMRSAMSEMNAGMRGGGSVSPEMLEPMMQRYKAGGMDVGRGVGRMGKWATGAGAGGGGRRVGAAALRMGAVAGGVGAGAATADFLNPWGLGWGD